MNICQCRARLFDLKKVKMRNLLSLPFLYGKWEFIRKNKKDYVRTNNYNIVDMYVQKVLYCNYHKEKLRGRLTSKRKKLG